MTEALVTIDPQEIQQRQDDMAGDIIIVDLPNGLKEVFYQGHSLGAFDPNAQCPQNPENGTWTKIN